jgi:hypothetical protein
MSNMYGQGNSLHEGNVKPLRGFTPRQRLDAPDPLLRVIGHATEAISLAGANTNATPSIAGEKYDLGGFVAGIFRVTWNEGANHATFQAYRDGSGDAQVKVMAINITATATVTGEMADGAVSATEPSAAGAEDAVVFFVDDDDHLVLQNDVDANSGDDPGPVLKFAIERLG